MKLVALPIACLQAPGIQEIPALPKKMEVENLVSDSKVLLGVTDICMKKSFTWDGDTLKEHASGIFLISQLEKALVNSTLRNYILIWKYMIIY